MDLIAITRQLGSRAAPRENALVAVMRFASTGSYKIRWAGLCRPPVQSGPIWLCLIEPLRSVGPLWVIGWLVWVAPGCGRPDPVAFEPSHNSPGVSTDSVNQPAPSESQVIDGEPLLPPVLVEIDEPSTTDSAAGPAHSDGASDDASDIDRNVAGSDVGDNLSSAVQSGESTSAEQQVAELADDTGGIADEQNGEPVDYTSWPRPQVALFVTGQQNGYIEPCGCTGLDRQKGGLARRFTFLDQLRELDWDLLPIDGGNQVRRFGRQAEIKYHRTLSALRQMDYQAVGFGPDDLQLTTGDLIQEAATDSPDQALHVSANVVLFDPSFQPQFKVVERGGLRIGLTTALDPAAIKDNKTGEATIEPVRESVEQALAELKNQATDFRVLAFFGDEEAARQLARNVPGFDLLVVAGGYGEPTYQPLEIEDSATRMIVTGNKGMYVGLVGIYRDEPFRYARVPLTDKFADAPEMRELMQQYQNQLRDVGFAGLGLKPGLHSSGDTFIGTVACGKCHTNAYDVWLGTPHVDATAHIVEPTDDRGDVARHFDPECLSCHVTGWNPQKYQPYESGFLSLEQGSHLTGNGCENCHGPGAMHAQAEEAGSGVSDERIEELRDTMRLPLARARDKCMECHDLDNSPDFHVEGAFEDEYWPTVEHYGLD